MNEPPNLAVIMILSTLDIKNRIYGFNIEMVPSARLELARP